MAVPAPHSIRLSPFGGLGFACVFIFGFVSFGFIDTVRANPRLSWSRRDTYTLGFLPFPIVFSTNLFLWFKPDGFQNLFVTGDVRTHPFEKPGYFVCPNVFSTNLNLARQV